MATLDFALLQFIWSMYLMPKSNIIFGLQTHCRKDGRPPDWILSIQDSTTLFQMWPNGNPWFCTLAVYYRESEWMPQRDIIFGLQTHCRKDGRPPDWIESTKVSTQLSQKRPNGKPWFGSLAVYYENDLNASEWYIFWCQTRCRNESS
jgi:hypothetical protein